MPKPFHELTLDQFADLVSQFPFTRRIESVHMHHTWRPNHADFAARPGLFLIESMFAYHTQVNHWSDIAQHITIDPQGKIWTGRNWNSPPASSTGFNGTAAAGPFMFEMIGDFDVDQDPFEGAQKQTAMGVVACLLKRFSLPVEAVRFHNQMCPKTCPGSAIKRDDFLEEVRAALAAPPAPSAPRAFTDADTEMRLGTLKIVAAWTTGPQAEAAETLAAGAEPGENAMNANDVAVIVGDQSPAAIASRALFGAGPGFTPDEKQTLRPHVINLRLGALSDGGQYQTSLADVQRIFNEFLPAEIARRKNEGQPLRLVFYAHGGLVSEEAGIRPVLRRLPFWRQNGLYPIFFCWETGFGETVEDLLKSLITGQRGLVSNINAAILEAIGEQPGHQIWNQMKRSAELASMPGGGARLAAEMTRDLWASVQGKDLEIHAVGHSAGSIFHAFFLPLLLDQNAGSGVPPLSVKSLHFLAPACTAALFESRLMPRIDGKQILSHTMYTMNKDLEQADTAGPYQKSLLYLVSRSFEDRRPTPILGLEESLRDDSSLARFYGLTRGTPGQAQVLFSRTAPDAPLDSATESVHHGDFDNEGKTMNSVVRRILDKPAGSIVSFVDENGRSEASRALAFAPIAPPPPGAPAAIPAGLSRETAATAAGARKALCMGIDAYPAPNTLTGCVNDARDWADLLKSLGFGVTALLNQQATREAMLDGIRQLISGAQPGDVIVIQYAGHGTQVRDADGGKADGMDEAIVPIDYATGRFLIDDDIRQVMAAIPDGVSVTCFMDCCHSGTNTRLFGGTRTTETDGSRPRFIKMTPELTEAHLAFRSQTRAFALPPRRTPEAMRDVNFAACRADQVAFETNNSGDFTSRAIPILKAGIAGLTIGDFHKKVLDAFGPSPRQEPYLDCAPAAVSRPLLASLAGVIGAPPATAVPVAADPIAAILARLDTIEARLAKLGS